jgi:hypothetical protein
MEDNMKKIIWFASLMLSTNLAGCGNAGESTPLFKDGTAAAPSDTGDVPLPGAGGAATKLDTQGDNMCPTTATCIGQQGAVGAAGPQGAAGPAGADGKDGAIGAPGAKGDPGPMGPQGPMGPAGPANGIVGPMGPQGAVGPAGAMGAAGPEGPQGKTGPQGPTGATGATGTAGVQGPMGPQGIAGPAGPAGKDGGGTTWSRSTIYTVTATLSVSALNGARFAAVQCTNTGDIVISGGCDSKGLLPLTGFGPELDGTSLPNGSPLTNQAWVCKFSTSGTAVPLTATAYCLMP